MSSWIARMRISSYLSFTRASCKFRKSLCFEFFIYSIVMSGCCSRIGMDEEKKELKLFFAFIHPNQWYGAEPPLGSCATLPCAGRSPAALGRPRRSTRGLQANHLPGPAFGARIQNLFIVVSWLISFKEIKSLILMLRCDWSENSHIDYMNLLKLFPMRGTLPESARRGMFQASRSWAALGLLLMLQETERPGGTRFNKPFWWHSCPQKC